MGESPLRMCLNGISDHFIVAEEHYFNVINMLVHALV